MPLSSPHVFRDYAAAFSSPSDPISSLLWLAVQSDEGEKDDWDVVAPGKGVKGHSRGREANAESMASQRQPPQGMKNAPRPLAMPLRAALDADLRGAASGRSGPPSPPSARSSAVTMKRSRNRAGEGQAPPQPQPQQQQGRDTRQEPPQPAVNGPAKQVAPPAGGGEDRRKGPSTGGPSYMNGGAALDSAPTGKRGRNTGTASVSNQQNQPPQKGGKAALTADSESGIDLVDFLQSTGSIIALSKYLDEEEPGEEVGGRDSLG